MNLKDLPPAPEVHEHTMENGLRLVVAPVPGSELAALTMVLPGGVGDEPEGPGTTQLSHSLWLGRSAAELRANLAEKLSKQGSDYLMDVEYDHVRLGLVGLSRNVKPMLEFFEVVEEGRAIKQDDFEDRRMAQVDELWVLDRTASARSAQELRRSSFSTGHPYGRAIGGDRRSLAKVNLDAMKKRLERSLCPNQAVLIAAGGLSLAGLQALATEHLAGWRSCPNSKPLVLPRVGGPRREVILVEAPRRTQALVMMSLPVDQPDPRTQIALEVWSELLAGTLSSRLQIKLRGDSAITYGAHAWVEVDRGASRLLLQTAVEADRLPNALEVIGRTLAETMTQPPTPEEIAQAWRRYQLERRAIARDPESFSLLLADRIAAQQPWIELTSPTVVELSDVATKFLGADRAHLVVVGPVSLKSNLEGAGWGAVRTVQ
ncbi:MAG: insulinase family protein [Deltaproteobacteria bacterium]|nr:insulinase family protein [Deltaproteobacteria bacterium]